LLLSVPFYVYEELAWENATMGGLPIKKCGDLGRLYQTFQRLLVHESEFAVSHANQRSCSSQTICHSLVDELYSARVYHHNVSLCWNELCDRELLVYYAKNVLNQSQWIHQYPGRHLVTTSHDGYNLKGKLKMPAILRQALYECPSITFEQKLFNRKERLWFSSCLVGNPYPTSETKLYDFALIATLKPTDERFADYV
jgi:hypothetical protein